MILILWSKFAQKGHFLSGTGKLNMIVESSIFKFEQKVFIFLTKFILKDYLWYKRKQGNTTVEFGIFELL